MQIQNKIARYIHILNDIDSCVHIRTNIVKYIHIQNDTDRYAKVAHPVGESSLWHELAKVVQTRISVTAIIS